jgi:hypothetical protein
MRKKSSRLAHRNVSRLGLNPDWANTRIDTISIRAGGRLQPELAQAIRQQTQNQDIAKTTVELTDTLALVTSENR